MPPSVLDAIFEALDETELFDCFVKASMENNLVVRYDQLDRVDQSTSIVRAQISDILCQAGFLKISDLQNLIVNGEANKAKKFGLSVIDLFEPAIAMSNDQIAGYIGMARAYALLGVKAKSQEYAMNGLHELEKIRKDPAGQPWLTVRSSRPGC